MKKFFLKLLFVVGLFFNHGSLWGMKAKAKASVVVPKTAVPKTVALKAPAAPKAPARVIIPKGVKAKPRPAKMAAQAIEAFMDEDVDVLYNYLDDDDADDEIMLLLSQVQEDLNLLLSAVSSGDADTVNEAMRNIFNATENCDHAIRLLINYKTQEGYSALLLAAYMGNAEIIKCIVNAAGALFLGDFWHNQMLELINCTTNEGLTALHLAAREGHTEAFSDLIEIIQDANDPSTLNEDQVYIPSDTDIKDVGDCSRVLNRRSIDGYTPWHLAAQHGQHEIIALLIADATCLEADELMEIINCETTPSDHRTPSKTPLALASENGHDEVCRLIIAIRALNAETQLDDEDIKRLILNTGKTGNCTPLRLARRYNHENVVRILLTRMLIDEQVPVFWSPGDCLEDVLISLIDNENGKIRIAVYNITSPLVVEALIKAHNRHVIVECITERRNIEDVNCQARRLPNAGIRIWTNYHGERIREYDPLMHNKYAIFYNNIDGHSFVATGSYNFTKQARKNRENMLVLHDRTAIEKFIRDYEKLLSECREL